MSTMIEVRYRKTEHETEFVFKVGPGVMAIITTVLGHYLR